VNTRGLALIIGLAGLVACGDSNDPVEPPPPPPPPAGQVLVAVGGLAQRGPALTQLPVAYLVEARDGTTPMAGVKIYWTVTGGGGSLSADSSVTGVDGRASVFHTLGAAGVAQSVQARAPSLGASDSTDRNVNFLPTSLGGQGTFVMSQLGVPANYGLHDTYIRDGIAFLCVWNDGVQIYDVGNGIKGGSPSNPVLVGSIHTVGGRAHNAWWFHNPNNGQKKYLFVGEEGPGVIGSSSSGDIHVVDVSNLASPTEVAIFSIPGAGTHNFWMDEQNEILYAAYYNGGVVSIDASGTLTGNIASREIDQIVAGTTPFVWGVQLFNGSVYASDMVNGLWQFSTNNGTLASTGGGNNVPERYTSDLWIHGGYGYTGTWGFRNGHSGSALKVWQLDGNGAPVLVDSVITANIQTVSDVEVSQDGSLLMFSAEGGANAGFHFYSLANPATPAFITSYLVGSGIHTANFAYIGGRVYAFGAKNPGSPELIILDVTDLIP
jgi:hypothetical protein